MKTLAIMAIPLTQGFFALVDGEDYEWLSQWKWHILKGRSTIYAVRKSYARKIYMHRQILKAKAEEEVDHQSHYGLDNRKQNIRLCTNAQNQYNQRPQKGKSSQFKGVFWHKVNGNWMALIKYNGKSKYLGHYNNETDAAKAYDKAAKNLFGEFAHTNF